MKLSINKKIQSCLSYPIEDYCDSMRLLVFQNGQPVFDENWGNHYNYYDLASLTKPIFTTSAFMKIFEQDQTILEMDVGEILGWINYQGIQIQHLLTHRSGLKWWHPFFKDPDCKKNKRKGVENWLQRQKPQFQNLAVYSDLDYIALGFVLESLLQEPLHKIWLKLNKNFSNNQFHFPIMHMLDKSRYAPTYSHQYQKGWVQGVVNDGNARLMGGVSSHAGLFGRAEDVAIWLKDLRDSWHGIKGSYSFVTLNRFSKRAMTIKNGDWAMGFMLPSLNSSCGNYFSMNSLGHLGFTGTSFWWDPKKDIFIVILANRYIQQKSLYGKSLLQNRGEEFKLLRPLIHNCIMECLNY